MIQGTIIARALAAALTLGVVLPEASGRLLPADRVASELRELAYRPTESSAVARYVLIRSAFESLASTEVVERLNALARQEAAPHLAWRAAIDRTRFGATLEGDELARFGVVRGWRTSSDELTSSLADVHRSARERDVSGAEQLSGWLPVSISPVSGAARVPSAERGPGVRHFVTEIYALRDTVADLRIGVSGPAVVSLDSAWLGEVPAVAFPAPDQLHVPLQLSAGTHHLMVSVETEPGVPCTLFARLVDSAGRRALFIDERSPESGWSGQTLSDSTNSSGLAAVAEAVPSHRSFVVRLRSAAVRRALGLPEPASTVEGLRLEELVQERGFLKAPPLTAALAASFLQGDHERMAALEALARTERAGWVAPMAAMVAMDRDQPWRARELLRGVTRSDEPTLLARIRLALLRDRPAAASSLLAKHRSRGSTSTRLLRAHFETALALGRPDVALPAMRALQASHPHDASYRSQLSDLLLDLGKDQEAISVLLAVSDEDLSAAALRLQAARIAARGDDREAAIQILDGLASASPDVDALISMARLFSELDLEERARRCWSRALERRPGDPELRAEWERAQPAQTDTLPFVFSAEELLQEFPSAAGQGPLEILGDETHIEVQGDGGWRRYDQRIVRVLRPPDSRGGRTSTLRFDPSRQQARVLRAEILREGRRLQVQSRELYQVTDDQAGFYYDMQELAVVFDDLQVGDVVTIQQRLDSGPQPGLSGAYGLMHTVHETLHKRRLHVEISTAADQELSVALRSGAQGPGSSGDLELSEDSGEGKRRIWRLRGRELQPLIVEPDSTSLEERSAALHVSTHSSWAQVIGEYSELISRSRVVTPAMRRWVEERRSNLNLDPEAGASVALARDLAVALARRVRYVGLEFGEHSYRPYGTDQVWSRRYGDCKDQSNLLVTLMSLVGIEAHIALVRTRPHGRVRDPLPSFAVFDHAIVYVPQWDLYFDPTSPYHGWGDLPFVDQDAQALVIAATPGEIVQLPAGDPERNGVRASYIVTLGTDGSAHLSGEAGFLGTTAADYRARLTDESSREERLEELLNGRYPGLKLLSSELKGLEASASSFSMRIKARVESLAAKTAKGIEVRRPGGLDGFSSRWAGMARRTTTLRLPTAARHELEFRYVLPTGWTAPRLPPEVNEDSPFGSYAVRWRSEQGSVTVVNRFELTAHSVSVDEYPRFRAFLERYDAALRVSLALERPQGRTP